MLKTTKQKLTTRRLFASIIIFAFIWVNIAVYAAPVNPFPTEVEQADGSIITIFNRGDEYFNWSEDENGYIIAYDEQSNYWCYALIDDEHIVPGLWIVGGNELADFVRMKSEALELLRENAHGRIDLSQTNVALVIGETVELTATINAPINQQGMKKIWSTSNAEVATVSNDEEIVSGIFSGGGVITAVAQGEVIITVTYGNGERTATCSITIISELDALATYENPILLTSETEFDSFLEQISSTSKQAFFYQVTNDANPLRENTDDFFFGEIIFTHYGEVVESVYCVKTGDKRPDTTIGWGGYSFSIPVPDGYKYQMYGTSVRFWILGNGQGMAPYRPFPLQRTNIIPILQDQLLLGDGSIENPYIINSKEQWDFIFDSQAGMYHYRVEDVNKDEYESWEAKFSNIFYIDLKIADNEYIRIGCKYFPGLGGGYVYPKIWQIDLPYGYKVQGYSQIEVMNSEGLSSDEPSGLPLFNSGDIVEIDTSPKQNNSSSGGSSTTIITPTANHKSGTVPLGTKLDLSTTYKDGKIYYTLDGTTPTVNSSLYENSIIIDKSMTVKCIVVTNGKTSALVSQTFTVELPKINWKENAEQIRYIEGYSDNTFKPDKAITRYEILKSLSKLVDMKPSAETQALPDVSDDMKETVAWFMSAGIIDGYDDGTFKGDEGLSRAEFVKIMSLILNLEINPTTENKFKDISTHWAKDYINTFAELNYLQGYGDNEVKPDNKLTRAEFVVIINRIVKLDTAPFSNIYVDISSEHWALSDILMSYLSL